MSEQDESQQESYQFKVYANPTPITEQAQNRSSAELIPPVQPPPMYYLPQPSPASQPYPAPGYGYPATYYPAPSMQAAYKQKKQLYFPLTRHASVSKQLGSMTLYTILMLALFAGSNFFLNLTPSDPTPGAFLAHPDGTIDGLQVLVFLLFIFLILPATFLLSGAFFGAKRAFLINCIVAGGTAGLWIMYASANHLPAGTSGGNTFAMTGVVLCPITATLVGFCYDRRCYAAWWKSFLTLLAGTAFFITVILVTIIILIGLPADTSSPANLVRFYGVIGCIWLLFIPLMTLPIAGIEGIIHAILAARHEKAGKGSNS